MQDRTVTSPADLTARASVLLTDVWGLSDVPVEAAFSHGVLGLMSEHTHYFNGFALLMPVSHGTAVAVRPSASGESRCVLEDGRAASLDQPSTDPQHTLLAKLAAELKPPGVGVEFAVAGSLPSWWWEVNLTSLGVAAARALQAAFSRADESIALMETVRRCIASALELPFSLAYPLASMDGRPGVPVLVDTEGPEYLMLEGPHAEEMGWGAVHVDVPTEDVRHGVDEAVQRAGEALELLQRNGFAHLTSFRELEHRDMERALAVLPGPHAPIVRYLVTENRRVQKLVGALRRRDWQLVGALMLMSHAVQRDDWKMTSPEADRVVDQVEAMSLEGLYGARTTGRSGTVLLAGQPFVIPNFLDQMQSELKKGFDVEAEILLL